ncbi:protein Mis18-alpha isoform X2 [Bubalus kerabau]|uniref:protein Mis18-alpha isoform X2 n=1 Tax=Bubalus carabanensis TaxID=3119969 RepID=UPI00244EE58D|nr:protein Mis18-alpha isoform X2 [Bubalus carabanensis]XP_055423669.1 protein Mis18-alpha isoform X2 [Bubalus carabanensis]
MAGAWSSDCCEGCSSTSCTCGHKSKWGDSSPLGRRLSEDSSRHQLLQKWASMWSSVSGDASAACPERKRREEAAEPAEEDRPLVFLCSSCRRPLGDSLSWVASQEDTNCILLRCVTCNVSVNEEQILSKRKNENGWSIALQASLGEDSMRILQATRLEWIALPFFRGSSQARNRTQVSCISGGLFIVRATREALFHASWRLCTAQDVRSTSATCTGAHPRI